MYLVTKAVITSVNNQANRCIVRMPLFETASSSAPVEAEALVSITPGLFNNLFVGDIVFVAFEENALEKPIIIGKLFRGIANENDTRGGAAILDTLKVRSSATIPSSTLFEYPSAIRGEYQDLETPKKMADYLKWLERYVKKIFSQLDEHFRCFKNWTQWQFSPENVEVDDGDLDSNYHITEPFKYQKESDNCQICGPDCPKNKKRLYLKLDKEKTYPNI
jgi:hypothetical protein